MTVRETLEFSLHAMVDEEAKELPETMRQLLHNKATNVIKLLGLTPAANTVIGDDLIRGVSGGERKRATIGEMIMGTYRAMFFGA